jgi:phage terminase large subunit-like protein
MWTEQTLSPTKFGKSQRWVETYAGFIGESPILEQLYDTAVTHGEQLSSDLELYRNGSILALWNTVPKLAWQTPEYYASEAAILPPSEFARVHRNQWSQSSEQFVPSEWWDACKGDMPVFSKHTPVVIGIDAAVSGDCFAMVGVSRLNEQTYVRFVYVWYPPKDGQISFSEPMAKLFELCKQFNVECCVYDEYQMTMFSQQVIETGIVYMQAFSQAGKRLEADKHLYDQIRERRITHDGSDVLREHVLNANQKADGESKLRIVKRQESMKIDAAVALSMCSHTATELEL